MNPQSEYDRALQGVLAMLPKLNVDGLWFMRGQLDAIVSHPRFIKGAVNNIIPFPGGGRPLNIANPKE